MVDPLLGLAVERPCIFYLSFPQESEERWQRQRCREAKKYGDRNAVLTAPALKLDVHPICPSVEDAMAADGILDTFFSDVAFQFLSFEGEISNESHV